MRSLTSASPFSSPRPYVLITPSSSPPSSPFVRSLTLFAFLPNQAGLGPCCLWDSLHSSCLPLTVGASLNCSSPPGNPNPSSVVSVFLFISPLDKRENILTPRIRRSENSVSSLGLEVSHQPKPTEHLALRPASQFLLPFFF